jgi:hypothetical protein
MRITIEQYREAKERAAKLEERLKKSQEIVDGWDEALKLYGNPRHGDEVVAFVISDDGSVNAVTRKTEPVGNPTKRATDIHQSNEASQSP